MEKRKEPEQLSSMPLADRSDTERAPAPQFQRQEGESAAGPSRSVRAGIQTGLYQAPRPKPFGGEWSRPR